MIIGDFTQWLPENMHRYSIGEVENNADLRGRFFYECKVPKGFRFRYKFVWDDELVLDKSGLFGNLFNTTKAGTESHYIEVLGDEINSQADDFMSEHNPDNEEEMKVDAIPTM